ncbi:hypothetical protein TELCIR_13147 [Teladorsagia circumcincta]|uniref:Receptor ligand binding region domain-containing protein n=1 Tax=Teladorsagia circumcincta TaxID=45464 RepID=A0A2G9U4X3_TELCI|nr:hypothetical protein TELCIR_13147 [Teladorsagia circumcincta]
MLLYLTTSQLLLTSLTISLKLGLIDDLTELQSLCEAALEEAKKNAACVSDPIDLYTHTSIFILLPLSSSALELYYDKAALLIDQHRVDAYVAPPCSDEQEQIGRLGYFWERPVFARTMSTPFAMNPTYFPNTVNVATASSAGLSHALIEISRLLGEVQITLVGPTPANSDQYTITNAIHDYLNFTGAQLISTQIEVDDDFKDLSAKIRSIEMSTKVVAFGTDFEDLNKAIRWLEVRRLSDHYYTTIMLCSSPVQNCFADDSTRSLLVNSGIIVVR